MYRSGGRVILAAMLIAAVASCGGDDGSAELAAAEARIAELEQQLSNATSTTVAASPDTTAPSETTAQARSLSDALETCIVELEVPSRQADLYRSQLGDNGATASFHFGDATALNGRVTLCLLGAVGASDFVVAQIGQTTAASGQQSAEWENFEAVWTVASDGLNITIHEKE